MDIETAQRLMIEYKKVNEALNRATEIIAEIDDPEEQKELRRPLGKLMAQLGTDIQKKIVEKYPDLHPDK